MDALPSVFEYLLKKLKRPIPDVPLPTEPPTAGHSSSSLPAVLADSPSNITPSTAMQQPDVIAQPLDDNTIMQSGASDVLPEAYTPQLHDPAPTPASWTQATGNVSHASAQPSSSSGITTPAYPIAMNHHTTTVPDDVTRQGYRTEYNQLALVPRQNFPNVIPNTAWEAHQPRSSGWTSYYRPQTSTSTLTWQPPVKARLPREADRSRLAKDILKQLGKPSGSVPAVPTRHEYDERKKMEARMEDTSAQPPTEPAVAEAQPFPNHDDPPSPPKVNPVAPGLSTNSPPAIPVGEPPLLGYPDPDTSSTPYDADATGEDANTDIQPPEDPPAPQSPASSRSNLPQESGPSPAVPESAPDKEERPVTNHPPLSEPPSSKRSGPPPDAEIIEISDDEEQVAIDVVTNTVEPMDVDEEVGTRGAVSQSLSKLSLDGDDALIAVEAEKDRTKRPLGRRSSQGSIDPGDVQFAKRKLQKNQPYIEIPPLPDYARGNKGQGGAPDGEGLDKVPTSESASDVLFTSQTRNFKLSSTWHFLDCGRRVVCGWDARLPSTL